MKYEKYKDSGVAWIGEVPSHWEVCKIKHKYKFKTGATPSSGKKEFYEGEIKWATISDLNNDTIYDTSKHITKEAADSCSMTISPKGSLLYSFKLSVGQVAFCGEDMYTNEAIATFESSVQNLKYLYYIAPQFIIHNANRNIYNAPLLNQDLIKNATIVLPPVKEQDKIVAYLDEKCGKINEAINVQKKKIDLLNELKQTVITNAVTKGLNPNAPMKDSGVEWIGEVPEHWKVCKLKYILKLINGRAYSQNELLDDGKYKVLRVGNFFTNEQWYFSDLELEVDKYCHSGDLLYAWSASFGPKIWKEDNTIFHYHIWKVNIAKTYDKMYAFYILTALSDYKRGDVHGSTMVHLTMDNMNNSFLTIPSLSEQKSIVKYIEKEVSILDSQISKANRRIELLNELKQSIITEAVTGKIKVY